MQLIATKARDFVYMDDISDVQSSVSGSGMGSKVDFDPLRLSTSLLIAMQSLTLRRKAIRGLPRV